MDMTSGNHDLFRLSESVHYGSLSEIVPLDLCYVSNGYLIRCRKPYHQRFVLTNKIAYVNIYDLKQKDQFRTSYPVLVKSHIEKYSTVSLRFNSYTY